LIGGCLVRLLGEETCNFWQLHIHDGGDETYPSVFYSIIPVFDVLW